MKLAVIQSNYIPWKGYFDLINTADTFIFYDHAQYTKNDWRNRNRIKTDDGLKWLTIPVTRKSLSQRICDTRAVDNRWRAKHWKSLCQWYGKARFFTRYRPTFEALYLGDDEDRISAINHRFITVVNDILGIDTPLSWSTDYPLADGKTERLVGLCLSTGATEYVSGPAAADYIRPELFEANDIRLTYLDFDGYPEYPQLYPPFEHKVSILDLVFNRGPDAPAYMKSF